MNEAHIKQMGRTTIIALAVMSVHSFRPPHATAYPINLAKHHETSQSNSFYPSTRPLFVMDADSRADLLVPPNASNCSSDAPLISCKGASVHLPWLSSYSDKIPCKEAEPLFRQILNQAPRRTCTIPT
jgi:hypothetical protein